MTKEHNESKGTGSLSGNKGSRNCAMGRDAMHSSNEGDENSAFGRASLYSNKKGKCNSSLGAEALQHNENGSENVAGGFRALYNAVDASHNTAIGVNALYNVQAGKNTAIGYQALVSAIEGEGNVAVGSNALSNLTEGKYNIAIGTNSLLETTTGEYNIGLGYGAHTNNHNYAVAIGYKAEAKADYAIQLGNADAKVFTYNGYCYTSDARDKTDIRDTELGLDFVLGLRPVDFKWNHRGSREQRDTRYHHGFIAQEIEAFCSEFGGRKNLADNGGEDQHVMNHEELLAPIVKAIQEQQQLFEQEYARTSQFAQDIQQLKSELSH